jgi:hypothetical protein
LNFSETKKVHSKLVKEFIKMRIFIVIFVFFLIGCSSDSSDFPPPKENQIYKHKVTKEPIMITAVGTGESLKEKADQMDFLLKGKMFKSKNAYEPAVIIYDSENADEKCIAYPVFKKKGFDVEWHIITVEELAENYELAPGDSLDQSEME